LEDTRTNRKTYLSPVTRPISRQLHPVKIKGLGFGEAIAPSTMRSMQKIINASVRSFYVRRWAEKITEGADLDDFTRVKSVYDFLAERTRYLKDPRGLELLKTPVVSLQLLEIGETPALDCDDLTILSLSLLKSIGYPVALRVASYTPEKTFTHVYGLVKIKGGWIPIDLVKKYGLGWEAPGATRLYDMEV